MTQEQQIHIFDNLVPLGVRHRILNYVMNSTFRIGWPDANHGPKSAYRYLYSQYTLDELEASGLGGVITASPGITELIGDREFVRAAVNLTKAGDIHFTHSHRAEELVVLYYVNIDWLPEWCGETMFFNDDETTVLQAIRYTPGRIVVFDGALPHCIRPQSSIGPQYRFTLATFFAKPAPKEVT